MNVHPGVASRHRKDRSEAGMKRLNTRTAKKTDFGD